jgi:hypothetical protein
VSGNGRRWVPCGNRGKFVESREEGVGDIGVELAAALGGDDFQRLLGKASLPCTPALKSGHRRHRPVVISRAEIGIAFRQAVGIALAVPALVMPAGDFLGQREKLDRLVDVALGLLDGVAAQAGNGSS